MQMNSKIRKKILRVELYENIRRGVNFEGLSIRGAASQFKVHRREVRNALASAIPPERKVAPKRRPKLGQYEATVRKWLAEDADLPRKQRHTATRIWERLIDECKADVSPSAVRVMVKELRAEITPVVPTAMIPQIHSPGESADVDYGDVYVEIAGELVKAKMFAMRLSCSGKAFHVVYASEAQECFFDGHEKAFEAFGGVPGTIRYDNLSSAVQKVLIGRERVENERFVAFRSHWGFISSFCTPGVEGAHEKGGIEGEIKRARRSYFVPVLSGATMAEINDKLHAKVAQHDLRRHIEYRRNTVQEDFEKEKPSLMPLAAESFGSARILFAKVDAKSRVSVRSMYYSVPVSLIGKGVQVALSGTDLTISYRDKVVAHHQRLIRRGDSSLVLDHYLETFNRKPGAFPSSVPLHQAKTKGTFTKEHEAFLKEATRIYGDKVAILEVVSVLLLGRRLPMTAIVAGINGALAMNTPKGDLVEIKARAYLEPGDTKRLEDAPKVSSDPIDLTRYDQLMNRPVAS